MSMLDGRVTRHEPYGLVRPQPNKPKRKRFLARHEYGMNIWFKAFSTRRAAHDWLELQKERQRVLNKTYL